MKTRLGIVTIGQAPRDDIVPAMAKIIGPDVEITEKGALDDLNDNQIKDLSLGDMRYRLVSKLRDGSQIMMSKPDVIPLVQKKITELNEEGVELILVLCTGEFPEFESSCPILEAQKIVEQSISMFIGKNTTIGIVTPHKDQLEGIQKRIVDPAGKTVGIAFSPYQDPDRIGDAAANLRQMSPDIVLMHCMGYQASHGKALKKHIGRPVLVSNTVVAHMVAAVLA